MPEKKTCALCGTVSNQATCPACGEASWLPGAPSVEPLVPSDMPENEDPAVTEDAAAVLDSEPLTEPEAEPEAPAEPAASKPKKKGFFSR